MQFAFEFGTNLFQYAHASSITFSHSANSLYSIGSKMPFAVCSSIKVSHPTAQLVLQDHSLNPMPYYLAAEMQRFENEWGHCQIPTNSDKMREGSKVVNFCRDPLWTIPYPFK